MSNNEDRDPIKEAIEGADNIASATLSGWDASLKKYEELTKKGIDPQLAAVEAIKTQHAVEATRYKWLAEQAEAAGDLKSASLFAKEAEQSAHLVASLSQQLGSAHADLKSYLDAREAGLLAKTGGSKLAAALIRKSGAIGNTTSLYQALSSGNDVEVTKALAGIAVGGIAGGLAGFATSAAGPAVAAAAAAAAAYYSSEAMNLIPEHMWVTLTAVGKEAISSALAPFRPFWESFLRSFGGDLEDMGSALNEKYLAALNLIRRIDPLVLDLDGDGIETIGLDGGIMFDFDGDGIKTATGWIKGDDGFLTLDRDGNGLIDTGSELFGVDTVKKDGTKARNGFDALADLDSNGDGVFDAQDEMYSRVRIWQDLNHDGIAQANELKTLAEHHIAAILLKSKEANQDSNGNLISATGSFIRDDGSEGTVNGNQSMAADVDLEGNPFYSEHTGDVELSDEVKGLPTLGGSGLVRELREAATLSEELRALLVAYKSADSHRERKELLDRLVAAWAATGEGFVPVERRIEGLDQSGVDFRFAFSWIATGKTPTDAQRLFAERLAHMNALESFNGQPFLGFEVLSISGGYAKIRVRIGASVTTRSIRIVNGVAVLTEADLPFPKDTITLLDQSYAELQKSVESGLALQAHLKTYADLVDIAMVGETPVLDFRRVIEALASTGANRPVEGILDAIDLRSALPSMGPEYIADLIEGWMRSIGSADQTSLATQLGPGSIVVNHGSAGGNITGGAAADFLSGNAGDDNLYGKNGDDWLFGGEGSDHMEGGSGNDTLVGGAGKDVLYGGDGSDTYVFGRGDGQDVIRNSDSGESRWDRLVFESDIVAADIVMTRDGNELVLTIRGSDDRVVIEDYFANDGSGQYRLDEIRFADGTSWTVEMVKAMMQATSDLDDTVFGYSIDETLSGLGGNDAMYGYSGNDVLDGGTGDDDLFGGNGADTLLGGTGNDKLIGDNDDDILVGGAGDDTLTGGGGSDVYRFGRGDGHDRIDNFDYYNGHDALEFTGDIRADEIVVRRDGKNLYLSLSETLDEVLILDYFNPRSNDNLAEIRFGDGTSWSHADVEAMTTGGRASPQGELDLLLATMATAPENAMAASMSTWGVQPPPVQWVSMAG